MEHEVKISPSTVRRLRTERGWSQEQLAIASGLSLRTIQRVEAEGIVSMATTVSLAATYGVHLAELQEEPRTPLAAPSSSVHGTLFPGLAVMTVAAMSESGRLPGLPLSDVFAAINLLAAVVGALLLAPALVRIFRRRRYTGAALAVLGTPLLTLLAGGAIYALVSGRPMSWQLAGIGAAGAVLVVMAIRELVRDGKTTGSDASSKRTRVPHAA